jgi:Family of unknown function (DUF5313)
VENIGPAASVGAAGAAPAAEVVRPGFNGRVYYLVGGTLPPRHQSWVAADCVGARWRSRQATRTVLLMVPFALVFLLLPGRLDVRTTMALLLLLTAAAAGFAAAGYFRDRRLVQHGLPPVVRPDEDDGADVTVRAD